jgi:photosystem II stability/assembly factor-like uncharacterized protein
MTWGLLESDYPDAEYRDVSFTNVTHGWIIGQKSSNYPLEAIVLFTDDGGDSWQLQYNHSTEYFKKMDVIENRTIWITGSSGNLFYTHDGGNTWNESNVIGAIGGMSTVKFINKTHGWTASNNILYHTSDSGLSWTSVSGWNFSDHPRMMQILSPSDIWASGYTGIYHSSDSGQTWVRSSNRGGWALSFVSDNEGWVIDDNRLAYTSDGDTWEELTVPMNNPLFRLEPPYTSDIQFINEDNGWIVGDEIKVMYTPDGGTNWYDQSITSETYGRAMAVDFINETHGWVVGTDGMILRTHIGNSLGNRLWKGIADPLFLSVVSVTSFVVTLTVGGTIIIRRRRIRPHSVEIQ